MHNNAYSLLFVLPFLFNESIHHFEQERSNRALFCLYSSLKIPHVLPPTQQMCSHLSFTGVNFSGWPFRSLLIWIPINTTINGMYSLFHVSSMMVVSLWNTYVGVTKRPKGKWNLCLKLTFFNRQYSRQEKSCAFIYFSSLGLFFFNYFF